MRISDWSSDVCSSDLIAPTDRKRVVFERHTSNSLNNRFDGLEQTNSDAVFSVDDDLLISCASVRQAYHVWRANKLALVGFSPRMHSINPDRKSTRLNSSH